ncbi:MAG TPA: autotransporter domain-containing protein [Casimicrobiaceae bacterium]|jgi:outer membrane lipase/esterase|nr:autotransporter domain-containing protein [Casimicrobiaceae bacterium]
MRRLQKNLLATALAAALGMAQGEAAAQFNGFVFFGDSLTDAGFYGARFTVNPGLVWAQDLGGHFGVTVTSVATGGTDFAQGGERVTLPSPLTAPGAPDRPLSTQIDELLHATPALNPNALYTVWIGANDIFVNVGAAAAGQITPMQVQANVVTAATQTLQQIARLRDAGARTIMVFNLPDIGQTPLGRSQPAAPFSALSTLFNSTLQAGLASLHVDIIPMNVNGLLAEVIANPAPFGFTNVTTPACTTPSSITCTSATLVAPNAAQTYLFADSVHPTPAGHQIISDYAVALIEAPAQAGLLAEAPLQVEQANFRALDARMISSVGAPRAQNKFDTYAVYDYGNYDRGSAFGGGNSHANSIVVGGDMKVAATVLAGLAFGYTEDKSSLGNNNGGFKLNEAMFTAYAGVGEGPWYLGATLGAGDLQYKDIDRTFALGLATRTESGATRGTHFVGRVLGGYWFNYGSFIHGPFARVTYQQATVYEYSETGTSSTAATFGQQKRDSFASSLGWQVDGNLGWARPWARATWEKDYNNDDRSVRVGLVSMPGTFALPVLKPDTSYALFDVGVAGELGNSKITGFITVNATAGKNDGNYQAVTVGIRVPL